MVYPDPKYPNAPKYLNSSATVAFDKGNTLYAFNEAKKSNNDYLILCEGYMDVISLHQAGYTTAVASLGTALTGGHAFIIGNKTHNVFLSFDNDEAGITAKKKAIPLLRKEGINVRIIDLTPYGVKDPDELMKKVGPDAFQVCMNQAIDSYEWKIRLLLSENADYETFKNAFAHKLAKANKMDIERYLTAYKKFEPSQPQASNISIKELYKQIADEFKIIVK